MHDAAAKYEPDTIVLEVDEPASSPAVGRTPSTEIVMHVLLNGERHRTIPGENETSCEETYLVMHTPTRREQLTHAEGKLCPHCFTPFEIARATRNDDLARQREEREAEERRRSNEEFFASLRKKTPSQGDR